MYYRDDGGQVENHVDSSKRSKEEFLAKREIRSITDILFWSGIRSVQDRLEKYRVEFELEHGPTDLTKHYTSMMSAESEEWLLRNDPKRWYDGLPTFVQSYLSRHVFRVAARGELDMLNDPLIKLYIEGHLGNRGNRGLG